MKLPALELGLLLLLLVPASAQVTVEVTQEQDQFLQGEALPVAVRITNRSGQSLELGAEPDWLSFVIQSREGKVVANTGDVPVVGEFTLESSHVATKHVNLAPYFTVTEPGRYEILATVKIRAWGREIESPPRAFDIIEGAKLWEQEVGIPPTNAAGGLPELRKFILQQANYIKGQLRLYLRVTDSYGKVLRVCSLGPLVSFGRPEPQVDKLSQLHVLYQNGASTFSYTVFNSSGDMLIRQTYLYLDTRPHLRMDDDGNILVQGGTRKVTVSDFPPPKPEDFESAPLPVTNNPAPTNLPASKKGK